MEQRGFLAFHMPLENRRPLGDLLGAYAMARSRSPKQKNGPVQPVTVEEELGQWGVELHIR